MRMKKTNTKEIFFRFVPEDEGPVLLIKDWSCGLLLDCVYLLITLVWNLTFYIYCIKVRETIL